MTSTIDNPLSEESILPLPLPKPLSMSDLSSILQIGAQDPNFRGLLVFPNRTALAHSFIYTDGYVNLTQLFQNTEGVLYSGAGEIVFPNGSRIRTCHLDSQYESFYNEVRGSRFDLVAVIIDWPDSFFAQNSDAAAKIGLLLRCLTWNYKTPTSTKQLIEIIAWNNWLYSPAVGKNHLMGKFFQSQALTQALAQVQANNLKEQ